PGSRIREGLALATAILALAFSSSSAGAASGWIGPTRVGPAEECRTVAAAIDSNGNRHVVGDCSYRLRLSSASGSGAWSTTTLTEPGRSYPDSPQIAIDGQTVYVAYNRFAPNTDTCGPAEHLGVYYRSRSLPSGGWSGATRLGSAGDTLESFRAVGGVLHAT